MSEAERDLVNDLLMETSWDAIDLQSTHRHLLPGEDYVPTSDSLVKVDTIAVDVESKEY